jgi:hypothetical protein
MTVLAVYQRCVEAIHRGELIRREGSRDKEFHFQNLFRKRLNPSRLPPFGVAARRISSRM